MDTQTKTIIHVVQHLAPGGLEALALNMLAFSRPNQKVLIVSLEGTREESVASWSRLKSVNTKIVFLNKPAGHSLLTLIQLYKLFHTLKPSVVHTHHIGPILYGAIAARLAGVKARIHTEHDAWHLSDPKHRYLQRFALWMAKPRMVADAQLVSEQLRHYFNYQDINVINNGVDCERFTTGSKQLARQRIGLPPHATVIGTAGRLEKVKGHDVLIRAIALLPNNIQLVIAGQGSERQQLEAQAKSLGIAHRVIFLGLVDDMARFYQALDYFCLPSRSEGYPLSTLEAQACDIVTLASNVGATHETLCPKTGQLFESENPQAIATSVLVAMKKSQTSSPREFVLHNNDIREMMKSYERLAEEKIA